MNSWRRFKIVSLLLTLSLALVACGDDEVNGENNTNSLPAPNNVPVPQGSKLLHTGECAGEISCGIDATFNTQVPLRVQLLDGNQNPIAGARVDFELDPGEAAGTTLDARGAASDANGFAEVNLRAGATLGVAEIRVEVPGDNTVEPIKFVAGINPKDAASYRVFFEHDGPSDLRNIDVFLFPSDKSCADIRQDLAAGRDDDPETNPMLTAQSSSQGIVLVDGTLPVVVFPGLMNGQSYTVSAQAYSRDNEEVELAFGCEEDNDPITNGASVEVFVDLADRLPRLEGTYDVVHTIRLTEAVCGVDGTSGVLPDGVCTAINLIGRLATDPASFLLGEGMGDTGLVGLIVNELPESGPLGTLRQTILDLIGNDTFVGIGRDALNAFFIDWVNNSAPEWVGDARTITADIYDTISDFQIAGIIRIKAEPVRDAESDEPRWLLEADSEGAMPGEQLWETVIVTWTGDCPPGAPSSCGDVSFGTNLLGTEAIVNGEFTGEVVRLTDEENPGFGLIIDRHGLSLNYGVLALGIIENVVLPLIFGDEVTSLDAALSSLLNTIVGGDPQTGGCAALAREFADEGDTLYNIAESLCGQLLTSASDAVREYMTETLVLENEDGEGFALQTKEACRISQPETYVAEWPGKPLPFIQSLGSPEMECVWDIEVSAGNTTVNTDSPFNGSRSSTSQ